MPAPQQNRIIFRHIDEPGYTNDLACYVRNGGYEVLRKSVQRKPEDIIDDVKKSGLRGRGGAGFPCGVKWTLLDRKSGKPIYLVVNADESEPGTFKDRYIMHQDPHQLIEGIMITCFANKVERAYIYIRGEFPEGARILERAIAEARAANLVGPNILGTGYGCEIYVHRGAGAYICGEETALLNSLEGRRGEPRVKPPFPASVGAFGQPTTVNNVETLAAVPPILRMGGREYATLGTPGNTGTRIYGLSGHVKRPGLFELPLGLPLDFIINDLGGGPSRGAKIKAVIPGGSSAPVFDAKDFDCAMDFDTVKARGSMAGSGGMIVMDDNTCMVQVLLRLTHFYAHESCGQCTPCREGCNWMEMILSRIEHGEGRPGDLDLLASLPPRINMRTLCPLGDAACGPVESILQKFRGEFDHHIQHKTCCAGARNILPALAAAH